jgi:FKBP-type peptidyl-prolyl cis-trans isomerase
LKIKIFAIIVTLILLSFGMTGCKKSDQKSEKTSAEFAKQDADVKIKVSYIYGYNVGKNIKQSNMDIDAALFSTGLKEGMKGDKIKYSDDEIKKITSDYQKVMERKMEAMAQKAKKDGADFLAKNKTKTGVVTLPSGLQYKVIKEGTGAIPKESDQVKTNYVGKLVDGTEFDSSIKRGQPAVFPVGGVIKGWQEALKLMKVGSKWELYIPPELAYEDRPMQNIPGNSTLIFEMELLSIEKPEAQTPPPQMRPRK